MDQKTLEKVKKWENFKELDPSLKEELEKIKDNEEALMNAFYNDIAFGTGGLRGILGGAVVPHAVQNFAPSSNCAPQ